MKHDRNATLAGLFIVAAVAMSVVIILAIGGGGRLGGGAVSRQARFTLADDLGGLRPGDDVRLGGYKVGTVGSIEPAGLDGADPHLLVEFSVPHSCPLGPDAAVAVETTLTGSACLNIQSVGARGGDPHALLVGRPDPKTVAIAGFARALDNVQGLVADVRGAVPQVKDTLSTFRQTGAEGQTLFHDADLQVKTVGPKAGAMMDSIHDLVGPSAQDFHGAVADLHQVTTDLRQNLPGMLDKINVALDGARSALQSAQQTAENTRDVSASIRQVITDNQGKLQGMIADFKTTGDNLKAASVEIRHSPWRLLYKPSDSEMANLNLYDAARQFADGASELNDAAQALKDASHDKNASPQQIQQMVERLDDSFKRFHTVENKLWSDVKQ